jgi:site-specific DNA recombinase
MARRSAVGAKKSRRRLRCAIYTRKSTEEGLEQDFNSLDAQREACEAFILSQKHEGWVALATHYDDGGYSGGMLQRPALQCLLADIGGSKVDIVVVYKIDRLTRALLDFAKIVEVFDAHGVSFVSVTQAFNTATSMGRLTLNVLLSFAQFEREVSGERIRDKIAASKKRGMWMGGYPPLGYDVKDRKLVVNEAEAETVRYIFRRYQEFRSVRLLKDHLDEAGIVSKPRAAPDGRPYGGKPIARGALYLMLQNRIYRGEIVHKDQAYRGEHAPIVDDDLWQRVQTTLATNRVDRGAGNGHLSLLAGLIYDAKGEPMTPSHAEKKGVRYRYYVSKSLLTGRSGKLRDEGQRIPAAHIEALVTGRLRAWLADPVAVLNAVRCRGPDAVSQKTLLDEAARFAADWEDLDAEHLRTLLLAVVTQVQVHSDRIDVTLDQVGIALWLDAKADQPQPVRDRERHLTVLAIRARLKRTGIEMRMVVDDGTEPANVDPVLLCLLVRAHAIRARLFQDPSLTLREIGAEEGVGGPYVSRLIRLAFIAPDIVTAILNGRHPPQLTANRLMDDTRLPLDWGAQRELLCS